jgi:glycosyltransferase involved in cell wall biosynthesis
MHKTPKISVIIPFFNAALTLGRCLESLARSGYPDLEIIVVDDRSTDESVAVAEQFDVRLVQMIRRSGAAAARNLAARAATGDVFFFVDADVLAPPGVVERVGRTFTEDAKLDAMFGAYTIFPDADNFASVYKNLVHHFTHLTSRREASTFWCGCGAVRRATFERVGGFDESYTAASVEDIELGYRMNASGARIRLDPSLRVVHAKRYTLVSLIRSDLLDRAVPWTRLMARENIFNLDLNLKVGNVVSAILLAFMFPLVAAALWVMPLAWSAPVLAIVTAAYLGLNLRIACFVVRVKGLAFAGLFLIMYSVTYLYSILGFGLGLVKYIAERRGEANG